MNSLLAEKTTASAEPERLDVAIAPAAKPETVMCGAPHEGPWYSTGYAGVDYRCIPWHKSKPLVHAISVDLEDWQQSVFDRSLPVSNRFIPATERLLAILDERDVRATFFVLANVARKAPGLIRRIADLGHEIQTHGLDHTEVYRLEPASFRDHLMEAKHAVEDITGRAVTGFRAPNFSIVERSLWALDVLAECGFRYDSSIVPLAVRGYGIAGWPPHDHLLRTAAGRELIECPVATVRWMGRRIPVGGGGYFRLLPYAIIHRAMAKLHRRGIPAVIYMHPYEFDPNAFAEMIHAVPWRMRLHQGLGRSGFAGKVENLLDEFPFGCIADLLPDE